MNLDEAIKHCEEVADEKEKEGKLLCQSESASMGCLTCAEEHRQLAEWLRDYKRLKEQEPTVTSTNNSGEMYYPQVEGITPTLSVSENPNNCDFQIGDEVRIIGSDPIYDDCDVGWVIRNASERVKTMYVMRNDGSADEENKAEWYKTGRHNAMLAEVINALPSVKPQENTGHWYRISSHDTYYGLTDFKCSKCGKEISKEGDWLYEYCPRCGAKMEVEKNG